MKDERLKQIQMTAFTLKSYATAQDTAINEMVKYIQELEEQNKKLKAAYDELVEKRT